MENFKIRENELAGAYGEDEVSEVSEKIGQLKIVTKVITDRNTKQLKKLENKSKKIVWK